MPALPFAPYLIAVSLSAGVDLQLHAGPPGTAELRLCLQGNGQQVRYELRVFSEGPAGRSQSSQSGTLELRPETVCPLSRVIGAPPGTRIEARMRWWADDVEQAEETQRFWVE
ncbi:curli-like amyloid fiber formation chaperone CsgH [Zestomonas carbonaria]|uniref:Uncharacterized protein n=1 Tax=Zestomonas carbonaria TaxID=2762745 RepID=A0A7U7EPU5_9GAMM|nr:curli-like amyloid fiber formation chaperone CsgH [Pseudomonas carbonaria]CAD5108993.1 hypothetical protein PSEWESI4_03289 [Pseudomonas carbonaria]